jgi:hypothetical protein
MSQACLNQIDLARRWRISPRTLERWRWLGEGPRYLKLGGRVLYRLADIEAYEQSVICLTKAGGSGACYDSAGSKPPHAAGVMPHAPQLIVAEGDDLGRGHADLGHLNPLQ